MIELRETDSVFGVADWIELSLVVGDQDSISGAYVSNIIEGRSGVEPSEGFIASVIRELERRYSLYRTKYFRVDGRVVRRDAAATLEYKALLLFSLFGGGQDAKLFERLTTVAVREIFGAESYCFGWPVIGGEPAQIAARVRRVAELTNEKFVEAPAAKYKDRGVDVVFWRPHDKRSSQIVGLLQCAVGDNWRTKTRGVPMEAWRQYIHWANQPLTAFAMPGVLPPLEDWHDISTEAGVLLDRPRLLPTALVLDNDLEGELNDWIGNILAEVAN